MAYHKFNLKASSGYYFRCRVFDTKAEMYAYFQEYNRKAGKQDDALNFAAITMPYERVKILPDGSEKRAKDIGEVLFCRQRLGAGLISHELLHCALWHERLIVGNKEARYGESIGEDEERLAYTLTDFVRRFINQCCKLKLF